MLEHALRGPEPDATTALRAALQQLGRQQNLLAVGAAVEPTYGPFEFGINDAVRPYETINAGDYVRTLMEAVGGAEPRRLPLIGSIDQLTHGDDVLINYTDWPARLTQEYRDAM